MDKIKSFFRRFIDKFKALSVTKKVAYVILTLVFIATITVLSTHMLKTKYTTLFSNLDANDSKVIIDSLDSKGVKYKVDNNSNSILVPEDQVGTLKLSLASELSNGSIGFEIFDESSQFGLTDSEFSVKYQRAVQGELERTIKTLDEVENVKVNLVMPEDSTFVKDPTNATAAVVVKLKAGKTLEESQVRALVNLVSMSVKNLPTNNITIADTNGNLLTDGLFDESGNSSSSSNSSVEKQLEDKAKYEKYLEEKVHGQLEPVYGKSKVKVKVNVDMDFDSYTQNSVTTEKDPAKESEQITINKDNSDDGAVSQSPVDENMSNKIEDEVINNSSVTSYESITNYNTSGKTEENRVQAPGKVKNVYASVIIDTPSLGVVEKEDVQSVVNKTIGQSNVENTVVMGKEFDSETKELAAEALKEMKKAEAKEKKEKIIMYSSIAAVALVVLMTIILLKRRKKKEYEEIEEEEENTLDAVIDDEIDKTEVYKPVNFDEPNNKQALEDELKKYAKEKPDQVLEIIKSWISSDER
ncbi:flagellar basal-body MS-ring/collar protein FliF [uncultured Clostridium sp.]|uniref:flagellar basal-body MS-ring/collar protein FliF n=1 Tax=uncultured Clostridium sp. TaxID=59620 RepID=UPI0025D8CCA7|nr:flagellar basal-body MS-ring/collar protein FliF [uncultured Clostridium sp.]